MLEILPPLFMRGDMFALRGFMTGSVTSIFFALVIDGKARWFHGYCDLAGQARLSCSASAVSNHSPAPYAGSLRCWLNMRYISGRVAMLWKILRIDGKREFPFTLCF